MSYYRGLAAALLKSSYSLVRHEAMTVQELLEQLGTEDALERVLVDDDRQRTRRLAHLTEAIREEIKDCVKRRIHSPLRESEIAPGSFLFAFADTQGLTTERRELYARYRLAPEMRLAQYELSPDEFELFCARVLQVLGCRAITITTAQKDDGVDVIAELPISSLVSTTDVTATSPLYRVAGHLSFLLYGQAKRYSPDHKVKQEEVFELNGSLTAVRNAFFDGTLAPDRADALRRADYRSADPALLVVMATSTFTSGARAKADAMGIVTLDGEQLAQLMLEASCGIDAGPDGYQVSVQTIKDDLARSSL